MVEILTPRLCLLALDLRHLRLWRQQRPYMEEALGLIPSAMQIDEEMAVEVRQSIDFWLINVEAHPQHYAWYTNWEIVLTAENRSIGGIGFNGRPDAEGKVTVGYLIDDRYHNQGYATESLGHLLGWAEADRALQVVCAETPLDHLASQRVLTKSGFARVGENDQTCLWERANPQHPKADSDQALEVQP
jgi:[ribosomal protein S5]-alanine N-acetyltransferase